MDLSKLDVPETAVIHIEHPSLGKLKDSDGKACTIEVYGPATNQAIAQKRKAMKAVAERIGSKGIKAFGKIPPDELDEMELDRLVALTASVSGLEIDGEKITEKNVRTLYENPRYGWIREQVAEKLGGWEDFLG